MAEDAGEVDVGLLEERAQLLVAKFEEHPRGRPLFVEFAGTPKSGKSSCIEAVAHFFRRKSFRVLAPTEGASKRTPFYLKEDLLAYNTWSACYALTHILEARYHSDGYHLAMLDRGLFDALVWFEMLQAEGRIAEEECRTVQQFLLFDRWRDLEDLVFLFTVDPEEALRRENANKLIPKEGRAMNRDFLTKLNTAYDAVKEKHAEQFSVFQAIDTSPGGLTLRVAAAQSVDLILGLMETDAQ